MNVIVSSMNFANVDGILVHAIRKLCHLRTSMVQNTTKITIVGKNHLESMIFCACVQ